MVMSTHPIQIRKQCVRHPIHAMSVRLVHGWQDLCVDGEDDALFDGVVKAAWQSAAHVGVGKD